MKRALYLFIVLLVSCTPEPSKAQQFTVSSIAEFQEAQDAAVNGDTIVWKAGVFIDIDMNIEKNNLVVMAEMAGQTIFKGASKVFIKGDHVTFKGFQFIDGNIGSNNVLETTGSNILITEINISGYTSYKYIVIQEECQFVTVSYSNFENRLNLDDKNILSVLVDAANPGYHLIDHCSFKNFDGTGQDQGIEPIRIGLSTQGEFISRTTVQYCYFTQCNGDGEIISNKARQNLFRYNTFFDNPYSQLVLRHGDQAVVYGNFFINNMGGVRVKEGQGHVIFNNYFSNIHSRAITLMNYEVDPLDNILVAFNTIVDSGPITLGSSGLYPPTNVSFANNIFAYPIGSLFSDPTGTESWAGNIAFGSMGIPLPNGITQIDPDLQENSKGYFELSEASPAIDAASDNYPLLPSYDGLETDPNVLLDLMQQNRPMAIADKDIGASEFPHNQLVQPHVTEETTGPHYLFEERPYILDVRAQGQGKVDIDPDYQAYTNGEEVTLTATAEPGYRFTTWDGGYVGTENPLVLSIEKSMLVLAIFEDETVVGVEDEAANTQMFQIFPNPGNKWINLRIEKAENQIATISILDATGRIVSEIIDKTPTAVVRLPYSTEVLESGVYSLRVVFSSNGKIGSVITKKFIRK